jgi:hypothetical protein
MAWMQSNLSQATVGTLGEVGKRRARVSTDRKKIGLSISCDKSKHWACFAVNCTCGCHPKVKP